jgi:hypothetical protein
LGVDDFDDFRNGVIELMKIEKQQGHIFYRNESCYEIAHFANRIYPNLGDIDILNLCNFFARLSPCEEEVQDEESANKYCSSDVNGFLGIDFEDQAIPEHKKIVDSAAYSNWIRYYQSHLEQLTAFLGKCKITTRFKKSYVALSLEAQKSINEYFEKAAKRNLPTRFYPDTKIVKEVSISKKCTVMELRIYHPIDLRVYFNEMDDIVYLASIEPKSNPDQNEDIRNAEKLLNHLASSHE